MYNELKANFDESYTNKLIMVTDFSAVSEAEVKDLLPKRKLSKVIARFIPRAEEEKDNVVVDNQPISIKKKSSLKHKILILVRSGKVVWFQ